MDYTNQQIMNIQQIMDILWPGKRKAIVEGSNAIVELYRKSHFGYSSWEFERACELAKRKLDLINEDIDYFSEIEYDCDLLSSFDDYAWECYFRWTYGLNDDDEIDPITYESFVDQTKLSLNAEGKCLDVEKVLQRKAEELQLEEYPIELI